MNINNIGALMGNASSNASASATTGKAESPQSMFMTLLVEQLKHQDPTQPQDGAQFVAQLAQFNSLDQLVSIKQSLEQLITLSKTSTNP